MSYTIGTRLYHPNINLPALVEEWQIDCIDGDLYNPEITLHRTSDNAEFKTPLSELGKFQPKPVALAIAKEQLAEKEKKDKE